MTTDTYGTLDGANEYHSARGNTAWASGSDPAKLIALLRGSEYIDATFRSAFPGYKTAGRSQPREWPRTDAYVEDGRFFNALPVDEIPVEVIHASYEAALRELAQPGFLTPDIIPGKQKKSVSVAGAVSVEYWSNEQKPMIESIGMIMGSLFAGMAPPSPLSGKVVPR